MDNKWISVNDQLPEPSNVSKIYSVPVIVYSSTLGVYRGHYDHDAKYWIACSPYRYEPVIGVTHWMPLPLPPTQE